MGVFQDMGKHPLVIGLSVIAAALIYLWGPMTEFFIKGNFNKNLGLQLEYQSLPIDSKHRLLVIHIEPSNRGNVPIELRGPDNPGGISLEIRNLPSKVAVSGIRRKGASCQGLKRPVEQVLVTDEWADPENMNLLNQIEVLRKVKTYTLEPGASFDEVEAIPLSPGLYWIHAEMYSERQHISQGQNLLVKIGQDTK